ncbi:MAG: DNA polymerase III subunit gamma/tau [Lachnospiraceae bacterium]|nr:DNA polymerase III subunit gamma/tau [Lachnospiraceae bacterium]
MSYVALYRKFRPNTFEDVKGQDAIVTTLRNQIKSNRIGHAYLFCGTRGTGKTTLAKIMAKAVNCENPQDGSPCGECAMCKAISAANNMNVMEIDAASNNGVENIREIVDAVAYSPTEGKYRVYIIDEVHMLSTGAFNALLKTLEEPPSYVIFILATTESHKIPITILSRCQRYDFKRISIDTIADRIKELTDKEQVDIEEAAIRYIARVADGSMRDALSLLDQCIAFHYGETLTYDKALSVLGAVDSSVFAALLDCVIDKNILGAIEVLDRVVMQGRELPQFVSDFTMYLRNLMMVKSSDVSAEVLEVSNEALEVLKEEAAKLELNTILRFIRIFSELSGQIKYASQKRILLEVAIIKLCKPQMETKPDAWADRIRALEDAVERGIVVTQTPQSGDNAAAAPIQKPKPVLAKAVPEEIKKIAQNWGPILDALGQPLKSMLGKVRLSWGDDNILLVVAQDFVAYEKLKDEANMDTLKSELEDFIQKEVRIELRKLGDDEHYGDHYNDLLRDFGMPIEVEDDADDE